MHASLYVTTAKSYANKNPGVPISQAKFNRGFHRLVSAGPGGIPGLVAETYSLHVLTDSVLFLGMGGGGHTRQATRAARGLRGKD